MRHSVWTIPMILALASAAAAQDGGKLDWKGKKEEPKAAMAEAKKHGKAMMLFFTSEG